ncbi:S-adenosylmethionine--2-demethylmenaquinone methyltransferase [Anaerobacillus arseniciselenatis]|uniref:Putative 4-hydroxy-4-methyl-2-oxoglutarate aldolase n=1 Tax=Anaerobacillus arseniciselenatis TaxID=85682 RepID=A0A1S2LNR2_9BACI|nr:S-adenosylmethionine--2-demethylmenaquinone methyltransferase [Anaerobacillus arseniciselenatis]OIJ13840.1 S-adenosylmethionine--2-demethylmenaquinone methyltransferase [Anaerobacillus arseniciselenatis]
MSNLPPLLANDIIERAKKLNTTLLSDAMECTGSMDYRIKPVTNTVKVVGTALTVSLRAGDNLFLHEAIHIGEEGYVIVADGKGHTENAYLGELMAFAARARGLEGLIINGLVRDKDVLSQLDFPIFATGFIPNGPLKDGPGKINTLISCGGVSVRPGDLIIGDDDGVVVVPRDRIEVTLFKAEKKLEYENNRVEVIEKYEENRKAGRKVGSIEPPWLKEKIESFR